MVHKFMVNSAFKAPLLLRPSYQRTVSFATVNKLGCPIRGRPMPPLILSFRSYSESTQNLPLPKTSGSTEGSKLSRSKDKGSFFSDEWAKILASAVLGSLGTIGVIIWQNQHEASQRRDHESERDSAIYDKLKKGPAFEEEIDYIVPRNHLVEEIRKLITPPEKSRLYPLIIGEHGTGKTSLIKLAINSMDENEPKGIVYVDIPPKCKSEADVTKAMQQALEWTSDKLIDSSESASLVEALDLFSSFAIQYKHEYNRVPVLIIDNANKLAEQQQELLDLFQDYAKLTADNGKMSIVFVLSEGRVPRHMMLRSSWSRHGRVIEIGDVSKQEAVQYLKLRKIDETLVAQIYEFVGGRMIHLKDIADNIKEISTIEAIRQTIFNETEDQLESAEILPGLRYHKEGSVIIRELLKKGSISKQSYYGLVDAHTAAELLESNVFAMQVNSREITFQSTAMKRFCEKYSALWKEHSALRS